MCKVNTNNIATIIILLSVGFIVFSVGYISGYSTPENKPAYSTHQVDSLFKASEQLSQEYLKLKLLDSVKIDSINTLKIQLERKKINNNNKYNEKIKMLNNSNDSSTIMLFIQEFSSI